MAVNRIRLATRTEQGDNAMTGLRLLMESRNRLEMARAVMDECIDLTATPPSYIVLEEVFGIPAGDGEKFYNLIKNAESRIDHNDCTLAITRIV